MREGDEMTYTRACTMISAGVSALALCLVLLQGAALPPMASAQAQSKRPDKLPEGLLRGQSKHDANAGTVTIVTERTLDSPVMRAALDLSVLLDDGERFEKMRI